jgi:hypothetical protein
MIIPALSPNTVRVDEPTTDPIHLFIQFYIDSSAKRQAEIRECLRKNVANPHITQIHMLNERVYTDEELGVQSPKIVQTVIGRRMMYSDAFACVNDQSIRGYVVIANSDILFDSTLENVRSSDIHLAKKMYAQLRYEYNPIDPALSKIFGPRYDSQDVWILHTNFAIPKPHERAFHFPLGKPGCDNKLIYIFWILGFTVLNDPQFIRTLHYHTSQVRNYKQTEQITQPWAALFPVGFNLADAPNVFGIKPYLQELTIQPNKWSFGDNRVIHDYLLSKIAKSEPFIIPRIAGIENNLAWRGVEVLKNGRFTDADTQYINGQIHTMKKNAGIMLKDTAQLFEYSQRYMRAFEQCDIYNGWEYWGGVYRYISQGHDYITNGRFANKRMVWSCALDIFNYIQSTPWTHALQGKRILVISAFEESIREKLPIRAELYGGVDLFPDCEITTIRPPQTQGTVSGSDEPFTVHFAEFTKRLDAIRDTYDVALVSCGGYGNLVCSHLFDTGKSSIYVGGVLQMYFGILGTRWLKERPDVVRLYLNKHWTRPKEHEKPEGYKNVEGACYW